MCWKFMIIGSVILSVTWATPPRASRQNFYNYRTDFDDDTNFAQFEGDTNGNYVSEFGQRIGARGSPAADLDPQDDVIDYSDNSVAADEEEALPASDGRRLKTNWDTTSGGRGSGDASYSFGYDLHDQSRHETSDSFGNIIGDYSYIDDEGVYRHVSYSASPGTGFVVHSKHASRVRPPPYRGPESPKLGPSRHTTGGWDEEEQLYPPGPTRPTITELNNPHPWTPPRRRKPAYVVKIRRPVKQDPAWVYFRPPSPGRPAPPRGGGGWTAPAVRPQRPVKVIPPEDNFGSDGWSDQDSGSSYPKDASYSFAYDAGDHNRHEVSDPWGNVRGSYSYISPDGVRRTVHYSASSATGFRVLKAEPSSQVSTVYREPPLPQIPRPRQRPQQPSAFVYHLHPDGGWKPWEASHSRAPQSGSGKPRRPQNSVSAHSYHYQSQTFGRKGAEENQQQTLLTPTNPKRQRRPTKPQKGQIYEEPQQQPQNDQQYSDADYETQELAEARFDPQRSEGALTEPGEIKGGLPEIRGYRGGYGDKNPLLVVSESASRPRSIVNPDTNEEEPASNSGRRAETEDQMKRPISIGKMMSLRMSTSQKKSSKNSNGSNSRNPNSSRKPESSGGGGGGSGPTMITNPGRLMHYPKSRNNHNEDSRSTIAEK